MREPRVFVTEVGARIADGSLAVGRDGKPIGKVIHRDRLLGNYYVVTCKCAARIEVDGPSGINIIYPRTDKDSRARLRSIRVTYYEKDGEIIV